MFLKSTYKPKHFTESDSLSSSLEGTKHIIMNFLLMIWNIISFELVLVTFFKQ